MTTITINRKQRTIEISKAFEKAASRFGSDEYNMLRQACNDNPNFRVIVSKRKNTSSSFKGLTFEYMEKYIASHDEDGSIMANYKDLRAKSDAAVEACAESFTYREIKDWFLDQYPEIRAFHERRLNLVSAA